MSPFLAVQNTYTSVEIALFTSNSHLGIISFDKTIASKSILIQLQQLLEQHQLSFSALEFIAVNQGPGPFTTLRVVISTVNGLNFASGIPLIGISSLQALLAEYQSPHTTIALLNAFSHDVYYAIRNPQSDTLEQGCKPINQLISELSFGSTQPIYFIGNGAIMHKDMITGALGDRALFPTTIPEACSIMQVGKLAAQQWQEQKNISHQLQPLYLKRL